MDSILADIERASLTIHSEKSEFCVRGVKIVGFVYDPSGKRPSASKVIKIIKWDTCRNQGEVRSFLRIYVFYRVFIKGFSIITFPLFILLRKNVPFI